jgi:restriction endonuclease Mrr
MLNQLADGAEKGPGDIRASMTAQVSLTQAERQQLLPSGRQLCRRLRRARLSRVTDHL